MTRRLTAELPLALWLGSSPWWLAQYWPVALCGLGIGVGIVTIVLEIQEHLSEREKP